MQMDLRVVELLSSKLCHDLISPVSAINNGVELIEDIGDSVVNDAMGLISDSAAQASRKLKFFRLSYGKAGTEANQPIKNIRELAQDYFSASKIKMEWDQEITLSELMEVKGGVKILLNVALICEEVLAYGGTITLKRLNEEGKIGFKFYVSGKKASLSEGHQNALTGATPVDDLTPRTVQPYVTGQFAVQFGFEISSRNTQEEVLEFKITHQSETNNDTLEDHSM